MDLSDHFFRRESGPLVAALTRIFGVQNLALCEDVAQDAFCRALAVWKVRGVPENPSAWLMATAKNRALDVLRKRRTARTFAPALRRALVHEGAIAPLVDAAFATHAVLDQQLSMMFSCCAPQLPVEVQLALILNILCGFAASELASVLLTGRAAIEKRLARGKKVLSESNALFTLTHADFAARLATVQHALYLLFSEGYHGACGEASVRVELCHEAMRLTALLREHAPARTSSSAALAALMCLHAARLPARVDAAGELSALVDQDRSRWDARLIDEGLALLELSATGHELTAYHVESAIAAAHASARTLADTDWATIVALYDRLLELTSSPVVALNRAIALAQLEGPERGLGLLYALPERERLATYPFYPAALAELELRSGQRERARTHFCAALALARSGAERRFLEQRLGRCGDP